MSEQAEIIRRELHKKIRELKLKNSLLSQENADKDREWFQIIETIFGFYPASMEDALDQGVEKIKDKNNSKQVLLDFLNNIVNHLSMVGILFNKNESIEKKVLNYIDNMPFMAKKYELECLKEWCYKSVPRACALSEVITKIDKRLNGLNNLLIRNGLFPVEKEQV